MPKQSVFIHKFIWSAGFCNGTVCEQDNFIGIFNRSHSVRYDKNGFVFDKP